MKKEKIPIPVSTLVLMIVTITYKLVLVVIGVVVTFFGQGFIHKYLYDVRYVFYLGTGLNVFCVDDNADPCVSSGTCKNNPCKRNGTS